MKYINKIFSLFAIALMAVACDPDAESYTPGGLEEGNQGICFAGNYTQTVEVEPGVTSFILTLKRSVTDTAGSVDIKVLNNEENIFICPSTASFAAGEATTTLTVETPSATAGILYNLKLAVSGDNVSEYTSGYNEISVNFSIIKWESIGTGYYLDGTVSTFFGVDPSMPMAVKLERAETATSVRFRFDSPFARVATETVDEYGGYDGYPFNEESDVVPGKYLFTIDVTSQGAALSPVDLGWTGDMECSLSVLYMEICQQILRHTHWELMMKRLAVLPSLPTLCILRWRIIAKGLPHLVLILHICT